MMRKSRTFAGRILAMVAVGHLVSGCNLQPTATQQSTNTGPPSAGPVVQATVTPGLIPGTESVATYKEAATAIDKVVSLSVMQGKFDQMSDLGYTYTPEKALRLEGDAIAPDNGDTLRVAITILSLGRMVDTSRFCRIAHVNIQGRGSFTEAAIFSTVDPQEEGFDFVPFEDEGGLWVQSFGVESGWEHSVPQVATWRSWWECTVRNGKAICFVVVLACSADPICFVPGCALGFIGAGIYCMFAA